MRYVVQAARRLISLAGLQNSAMVVPVVRLLFALGQDQSSARRPAKQHHSCRIALKRHGNEQKRGEREAQQASH